MNPSRARTSLVLLCCVLTVASLLGMDEHKKQSCSATMEVDLKDYEVVYKEAPSTHDNVQLSTHNQQEAILSPRSRTNTSTNTTWRHDVSTNTDVPRMRNRAALCGALCCITALATSIGFGTGIVVDHYAIKSSPNPVAFTCLAAQNNQTSGDSNQTLSYATGSSSSSTGAYAQNNLLSIVTCGPCPDPNNPPPCTQILTLNDLTARMANMSLQLCQPNVTICVDSHATNNTAGQTAAISATLTTCPINSIANSLKRAHHAQQQQHARSDVKKNLLLFQLKQVHGADKHRSSKKVSRNKKRK